MRCLLNNVVCQGAALLLAIAALTSDARANVYATNIKLNGATNNAALSAGQSVTINYILNEPASSGIVIRILAGTNAVRSISISSPNPGTLRGTNSVVWDGKITGGANATNGTYSFSIDATSVGYTNWTQTTYDTNSGNQAYLPWGIAVNQNTNSFYYGRVFVANTFPGPDPNNPSDMLGFQKLNADASPADEGIFSDGGYLWAANYSPFRVRVGADDRFYAEDYQNLGVVMSWDQQISTNSIEYVMRDDNNPGGAFSGYYVSGSAADRKMWMTDSDTGGLGVNVWNFQTNGVLATNDLGTTAVPVTPSNIQGLKDSAFDIALDKNGKMYVAVWPSTTAYQIQRFPAYSGTPVTSADWGTDLSSPAGNAFAIAVNPAATLAAVAMVYNQEVALLDANSGSVVVNLSTNGDPHRAVAWDNVGNLYMTFDTPSGESLWQAWSPPGANEAVTFGLEKIQVVAPFQITGIVQSGPNYVISFSDGAADSPSAYTVLSGPAVNQITNVASGVISGGSGSYQATVPASGLQQFYRIKR